MTSTDDLNEVKSLAIVIFDAQCMIERGMGTEQIAEAILASDWLRARDERNWDAGHNHCFHVDPPKASGNPHRSAR